MAKSDTPEIHETDLDRRRLLAAGALGSLALGAGSALAQTAEGQPMPGGVQLPQAENNKMRWAIVGLGSYAIGQVIPSFGDARQSRMTAFVSGNPEKANTLGERYGVSQIYNYGNYDEIANDPEIDCVYIVLPVGLHAEYTIRALEAGKHVLCEKPMANTVAECEAMVAAAHANNRQLGVAYRVHFEPTNLECQRRIRAGEIGDLRVIQCAHGFNANPAFPPHAWRLTEELGGGGSMYDIGIYGLNTALMMVEDAPVEVSAVYSTPAGDDRFAEVEGGIEWRLRMPSGASIQGSSSYCYSPYVSRQHYFGSSASIEMQPATTYYENAMVMGGNGPRREVGAGNPIGQFSGQLDGFSEAARSNTPHRTPGEMGLRDMKIIAAMYESADNGGTAVRL